MSSQYSESENESINSCLTC